MCGEVVAEQHGLGALQVGVARQHELGSLARSVDERLLELADASHEPAARVLGPEPRRDRDLVVARAARVHAPSERPEPLDQPPLEVAVDVLVRRVGRRRLELAEGGGERLGVGGIEQALPREHADVRDRCPHVVGEQGPVDRKRPRELEQDRIETARQAARPERAVRGVRLRLLAHYTGCFWVCCEAAQVLVGRLQMWMKPAAAPCWKASPSSYVARPWSYSETGARRPTTCARPLYSRDPHLARHDRLRRRDERVERGLRGREPEAVVDERGIPVGELGLQVLQVALDRQRLERAVRRVQQRRGRGLVDLARLDAHEPVLDHVDPADAMGARDRRGPGDQLVERELVAVDRDGHALFERRR